MRKLFLVILTCLALTQAQAASFDCAKAHTKTEKMICGDAELSKLDEDLGQAFRQVLQRDGVKQGTIESQRLWLKKVRDSCDDVACMKQAYQGRIKELGLTSSFGIMFVHEPAGRGLTATHAQPPTVTASPLSAQAPAPVPTVQKVAKEIPRLSLKIRPLVCKTVADAVSRGAGRSLEVEIPEDGLLIDINGDGKKERVSFEEKQAYLDYSKVHVSTAGGEPIEFNPVPEEERISELIGEHLIRFGSKYYIYGEGFETPVYVAILGEDNKEKIVCEFGELKPIVTIASSQNDRLCKLSLEHRLDYVQYNGKPFDGTSLGEKDDALVAGSYDPQGIIVETSAPNEASVDIDNDGMPDRVVGLHIITGAGNPPCAGDRLAVLNKTDDHLDNAITPMLPNFECMADQAPFMFEGHSYIEMREKIVQLKSNRLDTICEFHTQRLFQVLDN